MRHAGVLSALVATAMLLCALPGLLPVPGAENRADERLKPPELRMLTVWLMPGDVGDRKLIGSLCSAFEKAHPGVRVFLRVVTMEDWTGESTVLPDAALFETGDIPIPEKLFLPMEGVCDASGQFAGVQRAVGLWLAPSVMSVPQAWLPDQTPSAAKPSSLLAAATAEKQHSLSFLTADALPWGMLLQKGAVEKPQGVGWQMLLYSCPAPSRARLVASVLAMSGETPAPLPGEWVTTLPFSRTATPTPAPAITTPASVDTLARHLSRVQKGEKLCACLLSPAVSHHVRYAALCRNNADARAFVQFLLTHRSDAAAHSLIAPGTEPPAADGLMQALWAAYRNPTLPNAFAYMKKELHQLCENAFARCEDPVLTLLGLR